MNINEIKRILIDTEHLPFEPKPLTEEWSVFEQLVRILADRDFFVIVSTLDSTHYLAWKSHPNITVLEQKLDVTTLELNPSLLSNTILWVTENRAFQKILREKKQWIAVQRASTSHPEFLSYDHLADLLQFLDPSALTASLLSQQILEAKAANPSRPLVVGIGGPEDCGPDFFVQRLVESLEVEGEWLVQGLDGTSFFQILSAEDEQRHYWRSPEVKDWTLQSILEPFGKGERILIETPPSFLGEEGSEGFPLFLSPEMILVVWGTTLFTKELQPWIQWPILLELTPKAAAARLYGIDDRENFDPALIEKYQEHDGKFYKKYLEKHRVDPYVKSRVHYDNFHAFRLK